MAQKLEASADGKGSLPKGSQHTTTRSTHRNDDEDTSHLSDKKCCGQSPDPHLAGRLRELKAAKKRGDGGS